ncbi:1-phosphofructokinase family hexose kinase [Glutamicibacter soli]|uniref:1-phosphofructokinase family hexose kinase n=1 Tax=Glutamicibacter soli TaxID=453836 RepID=UPI003FD23BE9
MIVNQPTAQERIEVLRSWRHDTSQDPRSRGALRVNDGSDAMMRIPRVVTFTPAPSVDQVFFLEKVRQGEVNRAKRMASYLAGNGVNVARSLRLAGNVVSAVIPVGREGLKQIRGEEDFKEAICGVDVEHEIRTNVVLADESGMTTNINSLPAPVKSSQWEKLCQSAIEEVERINADWFVLGGALPTDADTGRTVDISALLSAVRSRGVLICIDSSIEKSWSTWVEDCQPDLIKPNVAELSTMTGTPIHVLGDVVQAANVLRTRGIGTVLASLGSDGILQVTEDSIQWARGPKITVVNTTGAGDAALAGYLSVPLSQSQHQRSHAGLRRAVSWGALAAQQDTTILANLAANDSEVWVGPPVWEHELACLT